MWLSPFNKWLETDTGKKCADYSTLTSVEFLKNRLYHAFSGGLLDEYRLQKDKANQLQATIDWYEERVKKLKAELQEKDRLLQELQPQPLANDSPS